MVYPSETRNKTGKKMVKRVLFGSFLFILIFIGAALSFNFIKNRNRDTRPVEGYNPTMGKANIL